MFSSRTVAVACAVVALSAVAAPSAFAQVQERWQVDLAPLYFWAATTDGNLAINGTRDIPVYMTFVPVGVGQIDFKPVFANAALAGLKHFVIEQDNAATWGDSLSAARISYQNMRTLLS